MSDAIGLSPSIFTQFRHAKIMQINFVGYTSPAYNETNFMVESFVVLCAARPANFYVPASAHILIWQQYIDISQNTNNQWVNSITTQWVGYSHTSMTSDQISVMLQDNSITASASNGGSVYIKLLLLGN